jgi:E3 ubiquitin-protein ligase MGRN1
VIKNSVNLRKTGLSLMTEPEGRSAVTFVFDSSVDTKFRVYFSCSEFLNEKKYPILASELPILESHPFSAGLDQKYTFDCPKALVKYDPETKVFPVIVETVPADEATGAAAQLTYLNISDGKATVMKQKLRYGDRAYELHEIFGIERNTDKSPTSVVSERLDLDDVNGTDCVICLTNTRDTTIIPCLHLCLCAHCAQVLSLNTRKCPVCRSPVTGMLQIDRDLPPPPQASPRKASSEFLTSAQ